MRFKPNRDQPTRKSGKAKEKRQCGAHRWHRAEKQSKRERGPLRAWYREKKHKQSQGSGRGKAMALSVAGVAAAALAALGAKRVLGRSSRVGEQADGDQPPPAQEGPAADEATASAGQDGAETSA